MTAWTIFSGVDAPDVTPMRCFPLSQLWSSSSGPFMRCASVPSFSATSLSRLQLELFSDPITSTMSDFRASSAAAS